MPAGASGDQQVGADEDAIVAAGGFEDGAAGGEGERYLRFGEDLGPVDRISGIGRADEDAVGVLFLGQIADGVADGEGLLGGGRVDPQVRPMELKPQALSALVVGRKLRFGEGDIAMTCHGMWNRCHLFDTKHCADSIKLVAIIQDCAAPVYLA